jgi:hypothetical protein
LSLLKMERYKMRYVYILKSKSRSRIKKWRILFNNLINNYDKYNL